MTWLELPPDSLFGVANLPYGVFEADGEPRAGPRVRQIYIGEGLRHLDDQEQEA